jgi:hypothetical protein
LGLAVDFASQVIKIGRLAELPGGVDGEIRSCAWQFIKLFETGENRNML